MKLKISVHGVAYEVDVEVLDACDELQDLPSPIPGPVPAGTSAARTPVSDTGPPPPPILTDPTHTTGGSGGVASPIAGTVLEVKCKAGDRVERGEVLMVIEAMKMETAIAAPTSGTIQSLHAAAGDTVRENQILVDLED